MKIVINVCYGGFALSKEACEFLGISDGIGFTYYNDRSNPKLVECVEKLGKKAGRSFSSLKVIEIPDGVDWKIEEYGGSEWVTEKPRIWR